jgi:hypothetical protein
MIQYIIPIQSALIAIVWVFALTEGGNIFDFWPKIANKISQNDYWIHLAYGCPKCLAGQISLWWSLYVYGFDMVVFFNVIYSIFITLIIEAWINK